MWVYPPLDEALERAGLRPIQDYVRIQQASVEDYVSTRPIFDLCTSTPPLPGGSRAMRWWKQNQNDEEEEDNLEGDEPWAHDL